MSGTESLPFLIRKYPVSVKQFSVTSVPLVPPAVGRVVESSLVLMTLTYLLADAELVEYLVQYLITARLARYFS